MLITMSAASHNSRVIGLELSSSMEHSLPVKVF